MNDISVTSTPETAQLESLAKVLEQHPSLYRVIRMLNPAELFVDRSTLLPDAAFFVVADTEATGKKASEDKLVELGMVKVAFDPITLAIYGVVATFCGLDDPGMPISAEATEVNKITDEMVAGKHIDDAEVADFIAEAEVVICHNSAFDRVLLEKRFPAFVAKKFACSYQQVNWKGAGITSSKQEFIAYCVGFFYDAHRADGDCMALVKILGSALKNEAGTTAFEELMATYEGEGRRIWATNAPIYTKDMLKDRGYFWSPGDVPNTEKAWYIDIPLTEFEAEIAWLKEKIFGSNRPLSVPIDAVTAFNRFSARRDTLPRQTY